MRINFSLIWFKYFRFKMSCFPIFSELRGVFWLVIANERDVSHEIRRREKQLNWIKFLLLLLKWLKLVKILSVSPFLLLLSHNLLDRPSNSTSFACSQINTQSISSGLKQFVESPSVLARVMQIPHFIWNRRFSRHLSLARSHHLHVIR